MNFKDAAVVEVALPILREMSCSIDYFKEDAATQALCDLCARAEAAYFDRMSNFTKRTTERTFSLEPLCDSDHRGCDMPGPPIYRLSGPRGQVGVPEKLETIAACLQKACLQKAIADARGTAISNPIVEIKNDD